MAIKEYPILYKYTEKGQVQQWQIIVDGNTFYTIEGIKDGKLTTSLPTVCKGKNIGKKNETTNEDQALTEANAKYNKKREKDYNEVLSDKKSYFSPMLAEDAKKVVLDFKKKTFVQPKLDGLRAINSNMSLMSRNGKPYLACPHLYQDNLCLDGELYNHELKEDFNKIVSLCKKQTPTKEELEESSKMVQFWTYDLPSHKTFSERYTDLVKWHRGLDDKELAKRIIIVPTYEVTSQEEIDNYHGIFLNEGYEGTIIRIDSGQYENKRSKQLLKYKDFIDEEFEIIGAVEGEGGRTGTLGKFNMKHDKYSTSNFDSNVKGDFRYLKYLWENRANYIGKKATVKYFNRTPLKAEGGGDKPRFPFIIKIDRDEYE